MYILTPSNSPLRRGRNPRGGKIGCKGTAFCAHSQINCTKSADLCTLWPICAINLDGN